MGQNSLNGKVGKKHEEAKIPELFRRRGFPDRPNPRVPFFIDDQRISFDAPGYHSCEARSTRRRPFEENNGCGNDHQGNEEGHHEVGLPPSDQGNEILNGRNIKQNPNPDAGGYDPYGQAQFPLKPLLDDADARNPARGSYADGGDEAVKQVQLPGGLDQTAGGEPSPKKRDPSRKTFPVPNLSASFPTKGPATPWTMM